MSQRLSPMKIQFCDLCNESVPEGDFAKGKAVMRNGRVVCSTCDNVMSPQKPLLQSQSAGVPDATRLSAGVGPGPGSVPDSMPSWSAAPAPAPVHRRLRLGMSRAGGGGAWVGVLALLTLGCSAWYFWQVLTIQRLEGARANGELTSGMERLESNLDRFSLSAQRREEDMEARMQSRWNRQQEKVETLVTKYGQDLVAANERLTALDAGLIQLQLAQRTDGVELGRRMDDLLAQSMKSRLELDVLAARVEDSRNALAQSASTQRTLVVEQPQAAAYAAEVADLASDVAGTRWNAVSALGETGDPAVVPHLIPLLKDDDVFVRMAVARVFGDLGAPVAIEPLIAALADEEPIVREAAMAALHILTGRDFRFDPHAKSGERIKRVNAWKDWWKKAKADFVGDA